MSEHDEQAALFKWAGYARAEWPELDDMFAIPNGGARDVRVGRKMKREGVRRGIPDVFLPVPRGGYHGLFLEMKTRQTGSRLTPEQGVRIERLREYGYRVEVPRGFAEAIDVVRLYLTGALLREK